MSDSGRAIARAAEGKGAGVGGRRSEEETERANEKQGEALMGKHQRWLFVHMRSSMIVTAPRAASSQRHAAALSHRMISHATRLCAPQTRTQARRGEMGIGEARMTTHSNQIIIVFAVFVQLVHAQQGCMDALAQNFDSVAVSEDGSCTYSCSDLAAHYAVDSPSCIFLPFVVESCTASADCTTGYLPGTISTPSATCTNAGCSLTQATAEVPSVDEACTATDVNSADDVATCAGVDISGEDALADQTTCQNADGGGTCVFTEASETQSAVAESCNPTADCETGYGRGTVATPSTTCTNSGCDLTPGTIDVTMLGGKDGHGDRPVIVVQAGEALIVHGKLQVDGHFSSLNAQIDALTDSTVVVRRVSISDQKVMQSELQEQDGWTPAAGFRPCAELYRVLEVPYSVCGAIYAVNSTVILMWFILPTCLHQLDPQSTPAIPLS